MELKNSQIHIKWKNSPRGWEINEIAVKSGSSWKTIPHPSGEYTALRAASKPPVQNEDTFRTITGEDFPGEAYKYQTNLWKDRTGTVALNTAGEAFYFFPENAKQLAPNKILFTKATAWGVVKTTWSLDQMYEQDIQIEQTVEILKDGFYSFASPTLASVPADQLEWATVPGYFHGNKLEENLVLSYGYGNGVPVKPIVFSETTASTLSPIVSSKAGFSFAVIANPDLGRDPWASDKNTHYDWNLGLSHMNRKSELTPTLYFPVLGEKGSALQSGDSVTFRFRYSLSDKDWFETLNHAIYDVFDFKKGLSLRKNKQSLSSRLNHMLGYLTDSVTSLWRLEEYEGNLIGAQAYNGGVVGSDKDAMKNADYGAMWMLANATGSSYLNKEVLPYALNFKMAQQQTSTGFFEGAAIGQYYLSKSKIFVEEWGKMVEPIALTYYIMLDIGNILLFEPENDGLKERLKLGADLLMDWQKEDGSWAVAYSREEEEIFKELQDFRPTFYGLLVAHRILKDQKYLDAAIKGADWYLENGVNNGSFLGVCGDMRYAPDFATGQTAQAYLDLFDITGKSRYQEAAVKAAKIYTSYIYTHPIPSQQTKNVNGKQVQDWEIAQAGLSFEHGGTLGSANFHGPILLASHAGMFIRMFEITGEPLFADMARSVAIGRHAFVDEKTSVASYYWTAMDKGAGPFPHHAWWQVGWITDYLMAEAELRSNGKIVFPRGFITPKVGPHQSYGFAAGSIFGQKALLKIFPDAVSVSNPSIEYVVSSSESGEKIWLTLLNQENVMECGKVKIGFDAFETKTLKSVKVLDDKGANIEMKESSDAWEISVPDVGLVVLEIEFEK
nr:glycerophosphoryl diester phosphodiesterase [Cytophagales bacterium]